MLNIRRLCAFFCVFLSLHVFGAATFYDQTWEYTTLPAGPRDTTEGIWYHGNCYSIAGGDDYNSVEMSTKYARLGSRSVRLYRRSVDPNSAGNGICEDWLKEGYEGTTARNEIRYGFGKTDFQSWLMGDERWIRISYYLPTDEGNYSTWNATTKSILLSQIMGANPSGTHELGFILTGGPKLRIETVYGTSATAGTEVFSTIGYINLNPGAWNDILIRHRRGWETVAQNASGHGLTKIWANCADWSSCDPVIDYAGPNAVRWRTDQYWKSGPYGAVVTWDHQHVVYVDAVKMGKPDTETESEMFDLMAADYVGATGGGGGEEPPATGADITSVNGGDPLEDSQGQTAFSATGVPDIVGCQLNQPGVVDANEVPFKWDYGAGTGYFWVGSLSSFTSTSAELKCFVENLVTQYSWSNLSNTSGVTDAPWTGDYMGYTSGVQLTASGASQRPSMLTTSEFSGAVGDLFKIVHRYRIPDGERSGMEIHAAFMDQQTIGAYSDRRIEAYGVPGSLTKGTYNGGFGQSQFVIEKTQTDGVYDVSIIVRLTEASTRLKGRIGFWDSQTNDDIVLLDVRIYKNYETASVTEPVTLVAADVTPPDAPDCTMTSTKTEATEGGYDYTASINCTAGETGGTDYAMITTATATPTAADVIAGTGAAWSAQSPATTSTISFTAGGFDYQDLWGWVVRQDAAGNNSAVEGVTFDDGVGSGQAKKLKWSYAGGNAVRCYNTTTGGIDLFTGDMSIIVTDGDYFTRGLAVNELAYDSAVSFTAGQAEIVESDLESGSINAMLSGDQGYNYWAQNADKSCRVDNTIQLTIE